jgi:glycosyltransferase involved in cell wall biosynthesis
MNKIIIHYVDWVNTKGNHAGMAHLCKYLSSQNSSIVLKEFTLFYCKGGKYLNFLKSILHTLYLLLKCKKDDTIFFMEYMTKGYANQEIIANIIHRIRPNIKLKGMVHLTGNGLITQYKSKDILKKNMGVLNEIWVLGSSLKFFILDLGINCSHIICTFHYVDTFFYKPKLSKQNKKLEVLVQGNQLRDYNPLKNIILRCSDINFTIMQGMQNLNYLFGGISNIKLIGFVSEEKLLCIMQNSDVALCVMEDTIGSNVITTSMACGLAMIVSDVGSIRDYCDDTNAILCRSFEDFILAINLLNYDREMCEYLQSNSITKAKLFSINNFVDYFNKNNC